MTSGPRTDLTLNPRESGRRWFLAALDAGIVLDQMIKMRNRMCHEPYEAPDPGESMQCVATVALAWERVKVRVPEAVIAALPKTNINAGEQPSRELATGEWLRFSEHTRFS